MLLSHTHTIKDTLGQCSLAASAFVKQLTETETVQMPLPPKTRTHVTHTHVTHTHYTHTHITHTHTGLVSTIIPCRFSNIIYSCTKTNILLYTHIHVSQDKGGWRGILWALFAMHDSCETKDRPLLKLHARSAHCMTASPSNPEMKNTG